MKYIKRFEDTDQFVKNSILIIDTSGSFYSSVEHILKNVNLYLEREFMVFLCNGFKIDKFENVTIEKLLNIIRKADSGGGDNMQDAINYIIDNYIKGRILIMSDGMNDLDLRFLLNDISYLSCIDKQTPYIRPKEKCQIFYGDFESFDQFYQPRDITYKNYELNKSMHNFNL